MIIITKTTDYFATFIDFVGPKVTKLLITDMIVGFIWFTVESSFIFILQGFLASIDMVDDHITFLPSWYPTDFITNILILLLFGIVRCLALMMKNYCVIYTSQVFLCEKRSTLLEHSFKSRLNISNNEMVSTFSELITQAGTHVVNGTHLAHGLIITILFGLACLRVAFWESVTGILFLVIALIPLKFAARRVSTFGNQLIKTWNTSYSTLLNGLKNIFFLRIHEMTDFEIQKGQKALKDYENNYKSYAVTSSLMLGLPQLIGIIVLTSTAWLGIKKFNTPPSVLISFFYLFIRLAQNASQTYNYASYFRLTSLAFIQLKNLFNSFPLLKEEHKNKFVGDETKLSIVMDNLIIGYDATKPLTSKLNHHLTINTLFLVKGPSGAGKTTLLKTILGETSPLSGNVFINNQNINELQDLSTITGYVGPEPFLIFGTVRDNLMYGNTKTASDEEIWKTLAEVGIKDTIKNLPQGLNEILLDETQLSSGQKQRLSFARALLRKPKFLILDEATANIDHDTESKIISVIQSLKTSMAIFVISHKNSFDHLADTILEFSVKNSETKI